MRTFFRYFGFPVLIFASCIGFAGYMAWKEYKINDTLVKESLRGNRHAIAILAKYEKPWKLNERIINGAIQGNAYALEILKIAQ